MKLAPLLTLILELLSTLCGVFVPRIWYADRGKEWHDLCWGDVQLGLDESTGNEYIVYDKERQTKTRSGSNPRDTR